MSNRYLLRATAVTLGLLLAWAPCLQASAASAPAPSAGGTPVNLNLKSGTPSITPAQNLLGAQINVAGAMKTIGGGTLLTPAELVAALQMVNSGKQTILLSGNGAAVGGSVNLTPLLGSLATLVVPKNVIAVDNTHSQSTLSISGALNDFGSLIGTGARGSTFHLNVGSLNVGSTGSISTAPSVNLSLASAGDITNAGSIASGGNVALTAGGSITNSSGGTISGATGATLFAGSGQINNAGTVTAQSGSLVLDTAAGTQLVVNNTLGTLQAASGSVNLRVTGSNTAQLTELTGGDILSEDLNAYGGTGAVQINAGNISGVVNVDGGSAQVVATNTPVLKLGEFHVTGDPLVASTSSVQITQSEAINGQPFTIIAGTDITAAAGLTTINTSSKTGSGGVVTLLAGVTFTSGNSVTVTGTDATGGQVDLPGVTITTGSTKAGADGGSVLLLAHKGTGPSSGDISLASINTAAPSGTGGDITIQAESDVQIGTVATIATGAVIASGAKGGGALNIQTGAITVVGTPAYNSTTGASLGGGSYQFDPAPVANSRVTIVGSVNTNASAGSGGAVTIDADKTVQIVVIIANNGQAINPNTIAITATGATGSSNGGSINLYSQTGSVQVDGAIDIAAPQNKDQSVSLSAQAASANAVVLGNIDANATATGGVGGIVDITSGNGVAVKGNINNSGIAGGNSVTLSTVGVSGVVVGGSINSSGQTNNNSVSIQLSSPSGNVAVDGGINGSGTAGEGATISIDGAEGVVVGGQINASGSATQGSAANAPFVGGNVTVTSSASNISIAGGINNSGQHDADQKIILWASTGVEVGGAISAVGSMSSGSLTITTNTGDVRLGYNVLQNNAPGTTPLLLTAFGGINVSSTTGSPGTVSITTSSGGSVYVGGGINASEGSGPPVTAGGISISAYDRILIAGPVNTSSGGGTAGPITLTANGTTTGNVLSGLDVGAINSSGLQGGGAVNLDSENGSTIVRGSINTSSKDGAAGSITSNSLNDTVIQGAITAQGPVSPATPLQIFIYAGESALRNTAAGVLTIQGGINGSASTASEDGATIFLYGQTGVNVNGSIMDIGGGVNGTVAANSNDGILTIKGNINTSSNNGPAPLSAGNITLNSFSPGLGSATFVTGNIIAKGGSSTGILSGPGGAGGTVLISTAELGTTPIGSISVGSIDTQGGNTTDSLQKPGIGGTVTLSAATVQLTNAAAGGASINASAGTKSAAGAAAGGVITVNTYGDQPIPANFNLLSTAKTVPAEPGNLFTVGNASVDGSAGVMITNDSSGNVDKLVQQQIILGTPMPAPNNITVNTGTNTGYQITLDGVVAPLTPSPHTVSATSQQWAYTMITPAEAVALYQTSRGLTQTFGVTSAGAADRINPHTSTSPSLLNIQIPQEFSKQFTSFVLSTVSNLPPSLGSSLLITVSLSPATTTAQSVFVGLPQSSPAVVAQTLRFNEISATTLSSAYVQLGSAPLTVSADGQIFAAGIGVNLNFLGSGAVNIVNNGVITSAVMNFRSPQSVTITVGANSQTGSTSYFNSSGSLGIGTPTGSFSLLSDAPTNQPAGVLMSFGQFLEKNITIGTKGSSFAPLNASMNLQQLEAFGAVNISTGSSGLLQIGFGATLAASGNMNLTTVSTAQFFASSNCLINSLGSINVTTSSAQEYDGPLIVVATNNINMISQGQVTDTGSQLTINAVKGNLVIGSSDPIASAISLTCKTDQITSGGNLTIYGAGLAGITTDVTGPASQVVGGIIAGRILQLGGAPALHIVNNAVDSLQGDLRGNQEVNLTLGLNSDSTIGNLLSSNGNVQATLTGAMVTFAGQVDANTFVNITSTSNIIFSGSSETNTGGITIKSAGTITFPSNTGGLLQAGTQVVANIGTTPIPKSELQSVGTVDIEGNLGVVFGPNLLPGGTFPSVQAFGGNIVIKSSAGQVTLGNQMSYGAFGGNISILGQFGVVGGMATSGAGAQPGNEFYALAAVNGSSFTGGGIEIRGGTTTSTIATLVATRPVPFQNQINLSLSSLVDFSGLNAFSPPSLPDPTKGLVLIGQNVTLGQTASPGTGVTLQGQNPVVVITGTLTGQVTLDSVVVDSATPIGNVERVASQDEVIVDTAVDDQSPELGDLVAAPRL